MKSTLFSQLRTALVLLVLCMPLGAIAQLQEISCDEAKELQGATCMLTIDNIYSMEEPAEGAEFEMLPMFNESVSVAVLKVRCTEEGIQVNVQLADGRAGFFKVADMAALRKTLRPATDADQGIVNF